ncbi:MAG: Hpt domain-containing protein [Verrucomicrobiota bacterium]
MKKPAPEIDGVEYDTSLPIIDLEQLEMLVLVDEDDDDSHALVRELYDLFRSESKGKLDGLASACQSGDAPAVRKIIHFVAGSAGNLGLARLCAFYRGIEKAIDLETISDLHLLIGPAVEEFELACEAFSASFLPSS